MKLLDILVKELDEWPDGIGVNMIMQDGDGVLCGSRQEGYFMEGFDYWARGRCSGLPSHSQLKDDVLAEDYKTAIITKQQWLDAKSKQGVVWNGLGFPPVGTVCEIIYENGIHQVSEIKYISKDTCVWEIKSSGNEHSCEAKKLKFLRIKTKEQIEAEAEEERVKAEMYVILHREYKNEGSIKDMVDTLYESGYRKDVTTL